MLHPVGQNIITGIQIRIELKGRVQLVAKESGSGEGAREKEFKLKGKNVRTWLETSEGEG